MQKEYEKADRGLCILPLGDKWQMATKTAVQEPVKRVLDNRRNTPLSQAALEVLAIIAYNQPVSRGFVEQVRGVDSSSTIAKLMEKGLVEEAGRLDLPAGPSACAPPRCFCAPLVWLHWNSCPRCMRATASSWRWQAAQAKRRPDLSTRNNG